MCERIESIDLMNVNGNVGKAEFKVFHRILEWKHRGLVNSTVLKKVGLFLSVLLILTLTIKSTSIIAYADWKYDFVFDDEEDYAELGAYYAASCLHYEEFDGEDITAEEYASPTKSTVTSSLLGNSKVFFNMGHGDYYLYIFGTCFKVADGKVVRSGDIPDLTSVHNGGSQLLAYIASCHSGDNTIFMDLREGFINEGSEAYLGFHGDIPKDDTYHFTCPYFESLGAGNTVAQALIDALADPDHDFDGDDIVLLGNTDITVADD